MNTTPDHPDFTALALGEHIHGAPARAVLDALRTSVAARQEAELLRDTAATLALVLKGQPPQRLDSKRRNAVFNADVDALRTRFTAEELEEEAAEAAPPPIPRRQKTWIYPAAAVAAIVAVTVTLLNVLPGGERPQRKPATATVDSDGDPLGRIIVSPVGPASPSAVPGRKEPPVVAIQEKPAPPEVPADVPAPPHSPATDLAQKPDAPAVTPVPESPRHKPAYVPNPKDYTSPPRRQR